MHGRTHERSHASVRERTARQRDQKLAIVNHADDIVFGLLIDRQLRVAFGDHDVEYAPRRVVYRNGDHFGARLHHLAHDRVAKLHDRMDEFALLFLDHALLGADVHERADVLFRDVDPMRVLDAEEPQQEVASELEHARDRVEQKCRVAHRQGEADGPALAIARSNRLGYDLSEE